MAWSSPDSWLTRLFSGDPIAILIAFIVTITLPALLHWYLYTTGPRVVESPTFLLLGPSNSGKTSLISILQHRFSSSATGTTTSASNGSASSPTVTAPQTRTSQIFSTVNLFLPSSIPLGSNKYRSVNDFEVSDAKSRTTKYVAIDTPGHGKLRNEQALSHLSNPALRGVVFMVDSAALDSSSSDNSDDDATRDAAAYLHDVLLSLQKSKTEATSKGSPDINVLIAANKQDLFTALPPSAIRSKLQDEIERLRRSRSKGIRSVDVDPDRDEDDENSVLGGLGEEKFTFKMLEDEFGIIVEVAGGAIRGEEAGKGVKGWEEWIGACL